MALDSTKWEIRSDKTIRYIGGVHASAGAGCDDWLAWFDRWQRDNQFSVRLLIKEVVCSSSN